MSGLLERKHTETGPTQNSWSQRENGRRRLNEKVGKAHSPANIVMPLLLTFLQQVRLASFHKAAILTATSTDRSCIFAAFTRFVYRGRCWIKYPSQPLLPRHDYSHRAKRTDNDAGRHHLPNDTWIPILGLITSGIGPILPKDLLILF